MKTVKRFLGIKLVLAITMILLSLGIVSTVAHAGTVKYTEEQLQEIIDEAGGEDVYFRYEADNCIYSLWLNPDTLTCELANIVLPSDASQVPSTLTVPSKVHGVKVTGFAASSQSIFMSCEKQAKNVKKFVCSDYMKIVDMTAFSAADSLEEITLGKYTKRFIGYRAGANVDTFAVSIPEGAKYLKCVNGAIYSKDGTILYYAAPALVNADTFKVSGNTVSIAKYAFAGVKSKTVKIPASVQNISKGAFIYSRNLKVVVPSGQSEKYAQLLAKSGVKDANKITIK